MKSARSSHIELLSYQQPALNIGRKISEKDAKLGDNYYFTSLYVYDVLLLFEIPINN
jgi:hypothetical protein